MPCSIMPGYKFYNLVSNGFGVGMSPAQQENVALAVDVRLCFYIH